MKNVIIAISIILVMGASFASDLWFVMDRNNPMLDNPIIESGNVLEDEVLNEKGENEILSEEELVAKYKLSDTYTLELDYKDEQSESMWNLINRDGLVVDSMEFESDGMSHKIEFNYLETVDEFYGKYNKYEVKLNGEIPGFDEIKIINDFDNFVAVIDLDKNDNYKELVCQKNYGIDSELFIYRVTKDGLEQISLFNESMVEINDKFIIPHYNNAVKENLVEGYYMYEEGAFEYIDRFLTGEKIKDENGNYTENFRNQVFTGGCEGSIYFHAKYQGKFVAIGGKVKLLKEVSFKDADGHRRTYYHCEVVEDVSAIKGGIYDLEEEGYVYIPAGTILTE